MQSRAAKDPTKLLIKRLINVRKIARTASGGKKRSISALMIVGNEDGSAGYGEGRAADAANAISKATDQAVRNMLHIKRFENRTVYTDSEFDFQKVHLTIRTSAAGYGVVANNHIHEVCKCFGIRDIYVKIRGSKNPLNVIKAAFGALTSQRTPLDVARTRGKKVYDILDSYYGSAR